MKSIRTGGWAVWTGLTVLAALIVAGGDAFAQLTVYDPAVTARNTVTAIVKESVLRAQQEQHSQLRRMAQRLSMFTNLTKYSVPDAPRWRIHDFESPQLLALSRALHAPRCSQGWAQPRGGLSFHDWRPWTRPTRLRWPRSTKAGGFG
jgi:hypothetical protein